MLHLPIKSSVSTADDLPSPVGQSVVAGFSLSNGFPRGVAETTTTTMMTRTGRTVMVLSGVEWAVHSLWLCM